MWNHRNLRDERSWLIGMTEAGFNINYVAFHFHISKTIAYRVIDRFMQNKLAWDHPRSGRPKNLTPLEERFIHVKTGDISYSKPALYNI